MISEILVATLCLIIIRCVVKWLMNPLRKLPGPPGFPLVGNTLDPWLYPDIHALLLSRAKKYGPVYKDYYLHTGYRVHIVDPAFAKHILVTNSKNYIRNRSVRKLLPALGSGLLTSNGKLHAMQRKHLNPMFSLASVQKYMPIFNQKAKELIQFWKESIATNEGKAIKATILGKLSALTLDVIGLCSFGYAFNCIIGGHSKESLATETILTGRFNIVKFALENSFPLLKIFPSKARRDLEEAENIFFGLIRKVIKTRLDECQNKDEEGEPRKDDLLQILIELYKDQRAETEADGLFNQIFTFMVAGHETTSLAMTWTLYLLAKYPEIQRKVREEIKDVLEDATEVCWQDLDKLKYLDNCIRESMRVYPPAIFTGRCSLNEDKFGKYTIPADTVLFVGIAPLQQDSKFWTDPSVYDPDRFKSIDDMKDPSLLYQYLPFSRGPRMCIGYRFAQIELKVVLALILNSFCFKIDKNQADKMEARQYITLKPFPSPVMEISLVTS